MIANPIANPPQVTNVDNLLHPARYQTLQAFSRTIGWPSLHEKAVATGVANEVKVSDLH